MSNGNGVVQSVSLADGTLGPDLRVNYNFGLVLGVNEFKQEQEYFLQKGYLYNRAFEGYGTVSGLRVTAEWLKGEDVEITVGSGMAIDQFGRPVVVREAQCARLVAWLKRQEEKKKGIIEAHRPEGREKKKEERERREEREEEKQGTARKHHHEGKKRPAEGRDVDEYYEEEEEERDLRIYIIARYDDYSTGQVPIAGQACNTGDTDPIYSRIHDSYKIDFSWDPPAMPAWESVRCFAKMMARVRITGHAGRDDTDEIIEQMRKLEDPNSIALCSAPKKSDDDDDDDERNPHWFIPADQARTALDRIFTTWVTEVRPKLLPGLLDPAQAGTKAQPDILLAHIDFTLGDGWDGENPEIEKGDFDQPDNSGRPYLLPTQVMQEMLLSGHYESHRPNGDGGTLPESEFATIQVRNNHTLHAWVHHPRRLEIEGHNGDWADSLEVRSNGEPLAIANVRELEPNFFAIHLRAGDEDEGVLMVPGARVELVFKVDEIQVERTEEDDDDDDDGEDQHEDEDEDEKSGDLGEDIEEGAEKVGEVAGEMVQGAEDVAEEAEGGIEEVAGEVVEDVGKGVKEVGKVLRRTIGVGKGIERAGARLEKTGEKVEDAGQELIASAQADERRLDREDKEDREGGKEEEGEKEEEHEISLGRSIRRLRLNYVGYDYEKTITVYTIADHFPVRELVTFFTFNEQADLTSATSPHAQLRNAGSAETFLALWFHTDDPVRLPPRVRAYRVFVGQEPQEVLLASIPPRDRAFSRFWRLDPLSEKGVTPLIPGELLTVIFNTNEIGVGGEDAAESLTQVMKEESFTCVGYDGNHTIEAHHQVRFGGGQSEERTNTDKLGSNRYAEEPRGTMAPAQPFVSAIISRLNQNADSTTDAHLELWFHLSTNPEDDRTGFTENLTFEVLLEDGRQMRTTPIQATAPTRVQHNVYTSMLTLPAPRQDQRGYYLRLRFRLNANPVNVRGVRTSYETLGEYIRATGIRFDGYNGEDAIITYVRAAVPASNSR
jgi:hypothetical protein